MARNKDRYVDRSFKELQEDRRRKSEDRFTIAALLILISIFLATFFVKNCLADDRQTSIVEVTKYVEWFHKNVKRDRLEKALQYVPIVVNESLENNIDPLLTATIISCESSWKPSSIGFAKNEKGLMQVHGRCAKGFDLSKPNQQIKAGVKCLRACFDKCKTLERSLTKYATGTCDTDWKGLKRRLRLYSEAKKRHRK